MSELINGRTPEEIKRGLRWIAHDCDDNGEDCNECECVEECHKLVEDDVARDALALVEHLESERDAVLAKVPKWISVKDRLPEKEGGYLVRKVHAYSDKDGYSKIDVCIYCKMRDPEWIGCGNLCKVTHWMPLPEPPEEEG